jgi:chromosome segregation ATPase
MDEELFQQLENAVNEVGTLEEDNKQLFLKMKKLNDEIKQLREYREKLRGEREANLEKLKEIAIWLETVAIENGVTN